MLKEITTTKWNLNDGTGFEYTVSFSPSRGVRKILAIVAVNKKDNKQRVDVTHSMTEFFGIDAIIEAIADWDSLYAEDEQVDDRYFSRASAVVRKHVQNLY